MTTPTNPTTFSNKDRKALFEKINRLSATEHEEIYRIIRRDDAVNVSRNKNGVFFNLSSISDDVVAKIDTFVTYCISNQDELDEYDKKLNECKMSNKYSKIMNYNPLEAGSNINLQHLSDKPLVRAEGNEGWKTKMDAKSSQKIAYLLDKMHDDREKLHTKKVNTKFVNAKKKYSKRCVDKKIDFDTGFELEAEAYVI